MVKETKRGYKYAVDMTIKIAQALPNKENKALYKKVVRSIFNDQLIEHTYLNRNERRICIKQLNEELKKVLE